MLAHAKVTEAEHITSGNINTCKSLFVACLQKCCINAQYSRSITMQQFQCKRHSADDSLPPHFMGFAPWAEVTANEATYGNSIRTYINHKSSINYIRPECRCMSKWSFCDRGRFAQNNSEPGLIMYLYCYKLLSYGASLPSRYLFTNHQRHN